MNAPSHKHCYGTMFPSTLHVADDRPMQGKVFACELFRAAGTFRADRQVSADITAWDDCVACAEFESCFRLCLGKLALEAAITEK